MTPEQLESLVLDTTEPDRLRDAFALLTDAERKKLSRPANRLASQLSKATPNKDASLRLRAYLLRQKHNYWNSRAYTNAVLAMFAVCPLSTLKRADFYVSREASRAMEKILLDRNPDWLDDWVADDLEKEFSTLDFEMLRRWIRQGVVKRPKVDGYTRMLASQLPFRSFKKTDPVPPPLSRQLLADQDLLDDVWRLFEVEHTAFSGEGWYEANMPKDYESWSDALVRLVEEGYLDRARLLNASLQGLSADFKRDQLLGLHKLHERLEPSQAEMQEREAEYLSLLCHKAGYVVKFALRMLARLEKQKALSVEPFLAEVGAVFFQDAKGNPRSALAMIRRILKKHPEYVHMGLRETCAALRHASLDVQTTACDLLEDYRQGISREISDELRNLLDFVSASLRARVAALADGPDSSVPLAEAANDERHAAEGEKVRLIDNSADALDDVSLHARVSDILACRVLVDADPLKPIVDLDDLIAAVAHAVEVVEYPDLVERILDGISRLCATRPDDFEERIAPVLHRLRSDEGLRTREGIAGLDGGVRLAFADLLIAWLTARPSNTWVRDRLSHADATRPAIARIRQIANRVAYGRAQPLVGVPTHTGGWIDPLVWVERIRTAQREARKLDRMDLCISFLRLAPDNRAEALKTADCLAGDVGRVARCTLGEAVHPTFADRKNYDLWISAARASEPYTDWRRPFRAMRLLDDWPDSVCPAGFRWSVRTQEIRGVKVPRMDIEVFTGSPNVTQKSIHADRKTQGLSAAINRAARLLTQPVRTDWKRLPTVALHRSVESKVTWFSELSTNWVTQWLSYQWPLCTDGYYLIGVARLMDRIDMDSSNWEPNYGFFHALFEKKRPWGEPAHLLLGLGLVGKDADTRGLAVDALIEGVDDGKLDVMLLAGVLRGLTHGGWLKLNRMSDTFHQVSQVSMRHAYVVGQVLQAWLPVSEPKQTNIVRILETLLEAQAVVGQPLGLEAINALEAFKGNSKSARLAAQLRDL